jgi:hypothetical protein
MRRLSTYQHRIVRLAVIAGAALLPAIAHAQLTVAGSTAGCFGAGCTSFGTTATYGSSGLSYQSGSFSTTLSNAADLDDVVVGSLRLTEDNSNNINNGVFRLRFTFTSPATAPQTIFTADVDGTYNRFSYDDATVTFGGPQTINFAGGSFQLWVQDVQLNPSFLNSPDVDPIEAKIYGLQTVSGGPSNVVPEPSTYVLLATGIAALGGVARRRRNAAA